MTTRIRVNVGCGMSPTPGWVNIDNSATLHLAHRPRLSSLLERLQLLDKPRAAFVKVARAENIRQAKATALPFTDGSVDVLYSSHMIEHLTRPQASAFLQEARRVLGPGCVLRLVVPDLKKIAMRYLEDGDADTFVESTLLASADQGSWVGRLKRLVVGDRHHLWMYDATSLMRLLAANGFVDAVELPPGETTIDDPAALNLREQYEESIFVEARRG